MGPREYGQIVWSFKTYVSWTGSFYGIDGGKTERVQTFHCRDLSTYFLLRVYDTTKGSGLWVLSDPGTFRTTGPQSLFGSNWKGNLLPVDDWDLDGPFSTVEWVGSSLDP